MKRSEQAALKAYPKSDFNGVETRRKGQRKCFIQGYEQAEKDLALTKDDVWCIFNLVRELQVKYSTTDGCLQEVADIFNEEKLNPKKGL